MNTAANQSKPPQHRVVFFGTHSVFSHSVMNMLVNRGVNIVAMVMPGIEPESELGSIGGIPIVQNANHNTIERLALERHIPAKYVQVDNLKQLHFELQKFQPDYLLVACFPFKLPPEVWQLPKVAALNIHPSMLPGYRGAHPVFWQLKNGEMKTGVTLHLLNDEIDAGDIVIQAEVPLRPGMRGRAIETRLGEFGAKLFLEALRLYQLNNVNIQPQSWIQASYMPEPKYEDFELSTKWSARRAFMFMKGTEEWGRTYPVKAGNKMVHIKTAMAYSPSGRISSPYKLEDNYITLQFSPGLVSAYIESID